MNNEAINEAIMWTAALIAIVVVLFLVLKSLGAKKTGKEIPRTAETTHRPGDSEAEKPGTADTGKEDTVFKSGKERANLLYIPPELAQSAAKKADGRRGYTVSLGEESLFGTGTDGSTEIRGLYGEHRINSDISSEGASGAVGADGSAGSAGVSSGEVPEQDSAFSAGNEDKDVLQIYRYKAAVKKWVCPYCELENPDWTGVCQVCGEIRVRA